MKSINIITKATRLHLKQNNTTGIRCTLCYAAVVLGIVALLIGCPDSMGNDDNNGGNDDAIGTPTEATRVQSAASGAITIDTITLNWAVPTDTVGLLGVTISEENNAGSLSDSVAVDADATTYTVTDLEAGTAYVFTITTRYTASGKNNSIAIMAMTALSTEVQRVALVVSETTSDSVTLSWEDPADTDGYTGVTISTASTVGDLDMNMPRTVAQGTNTLTISDLAAETEYMLMLTFTTEYSTDKGSSSDHTIPVATQSTLVTNVIASTITSDSVTLSWDDPEDTVGYTGVTISATATVGDFSAPATMGVGTNTLTISNLAAETPYTLTLTFTTAYSDGKNGGSSEHSVEFITQSNYITAFVPSTITATTITLSWANPEDRVEYAGVTISANPAHGDLSNEIQINASSGSMFGQLAVTGLTVGTEYMFTIAARYTGGKTAGADATITVTSAPPIDTDNDNLIDITSVERLYNIRYNLDLSDGRYKTNAHDAGIRCGSAQNTDCIGYELIHNLDFASADSYQSGIVNTNWRPQDSSGMVLTQENASSAINAGWEPIGSCNTNTGNHDTVSCDDDDDTPFATYFEGNGYTISNLYARNTTANDGSGIGLFGITADGATIRSIGVQHIALYGDKSSDRVGGIAGQHAGTIVGSYVSGRVTGNAPLTNIGGLVGYSSGTIIASYAAVAVSSNGLNGIAGGLAGHTAADTIIASYASGTVIGSLDTGERIGGLVGLHNGDSTTATYASGAVDGIDDLDIVGGLISSGSGNIIASYASGSVNGGGGFAGALGTFLSSRDVHASYGFGSIAMGVLGSAGTAKPTVDGTPGTAAITMATQLTAINAGDIWNDADNDTLNAWDFGTAAQPPALRYADYDGADNDDYICGDNSVLTGIPSMVAGPGGPIPVDCGTTLLPGQR